MGKQNLIVPALLLVVPSIVLADSGPASKVQLGGVIEVEAASVDAAGVKTSDIVVSTVELSFDAQLNDRVSGHVLMLHEEDDTALEIDEGTITVHLNGEHSVYLTAGQTYLPFGHFETQMVSDPLTLELGETRQTLLQMSFESNGLTASAYAYNGDITEANQDDKVANYGANIGYAAEMAGYSLDTGVSYISNIADAFGFMDSLPDGDSDGAVDPIESFVSGMAAYAIISKGSLKAILEYVRSDEFAASTLDYKGEGAAPSAFNIELGYNIDGKSTIAAGYQSSEQATAMGLLETKQLITYSRTVFDAASLAVEYAQGDYYSLNDGGNGDDLRAITARLAVAF